VGHSRRKRLRRLRLRGQGGDGATAAAAAAAAATTTTTTTTTATIATGCGREAWPPPLRQPRALRPSCKKLGHGRADVLHGDLKRRSKVAAAATTTTAASTGTARVRVGVVRLGTQPQIAVLAHQREHALRVARVGPSRPLQHADDDAGLRPVHPFAVADVVTVVVVVVVVVVVPVPVLVLAGVADATRQLSEGALQLGARGFGRGALAVVAFVRLPLPLEGARALLRHEPLHEAHALARVPVSEVHVPARTTRR
jgi:hypothetical protein